MVIRIEAACAGDGWSYKHGDVLEYDKDIPKDRARMLLNGGLATPVRDQPIETADKPVHKGRGVFELPDGRRIKGKQAAYAAMEG